MSESKNAVSVRIAGEEHVIRSAAEPDYTRRCARFVDERVTDLRIRSPGPMETPRATILAALSITDELFRAREELARLRAEVLTRGDAVVRTIEAGLEGGREGEGAAEPPVA